MQYLLAGYQPGMGTFSKRSKIRNKVSCLTKWETDTGYK